MDQTDHTKNTWMRMRKEANFGGGNTGLEYAKTKADDWLDLTYVLPFISGEQTMPFMKFDREEVHAAGDDISDVHLFTKDKTGKDSGHKYYFQDSEFLEAALSGTAGNPGDSYMCHWKKPEGEFEAYGMAVSEWSFDYGGKGNFPTQGVKWKYYDVISNPTVITPSAGSTVQSDGVSTISTGNFTSALSDFVTDEIMPFDILEITGGTGGGDKGRYLITSVTDLNTLVVTPIFPAGDTAVVFTIKPMVFRTDQPLTTKDITLEVDATAVNIKNLSYTIANEFEESSQSGEWVFGKPGIVSRDVTGSLTISTKIPGLLSDENTEDVPLHDLEITFGSLGTLTLSNVYVKVTNQETIPEFGMYEYTAEFGRGDGFSAVFT